MRFRPASERFWEKVEKTDACWLWTGFRNHLGYGRFNRTHSEGVFAHRFAYESSFGPITDGLYVCHKCDNPSCVRPDHLFLGTSMDNYLDMERKGRRFIQPRNDTCCNGHSKADAYYRPRRGWTCRTCAVEKARQRRARSSQAGSAKCA